MSELWFPSKNLSCFASVIFTDQPDFYGPATKSAATESAVSRGPKLAEFEKSGREGGHMAGWLPPHNN